MAAILMAIHDLLSLELDCVSSHIDIGCVSKAWESLFKTACCLVLSNARVLVEVPAADKPLGSGASSCV